VTFTPRPSPLSAADAAAGRVRLGDLVVDGDSAYWTEMRPQERGRSVIVQWSDSEPEDVLPAPWSARTAVHEYGGGALCVADGVLYFSNADDGGLYRLRPGAGDPQLLRAGGAERYADFIADPARRRLITVVEDHSGAAVVNRIDAVPLAGGAASTLTEGADFYAAPRLSPDGTQLAWLSWNLPAMPWDATDLWVASVAADGSLAVPRLVAGGPDESVLYPGWSPEGQLHFISDRADWWNLHAEEEDGIRRVADIPADCALPPWVFGEMPYAFIDTGGIVIAVGRTGEWGLELIEPDGRTRRLVPELTDVGEHVRWCRNRIVADAGSPVMAGSIVAVDVPSGATEILREGGRLEVDATLLSTARPFTFASVDGEAHGLLHLPVSPGDAPPPLILRAHGGPTAQAGTSLDSVVQFFTTRGFAFCDVDYRGSTGYGRAYRQMLNGRNGEIDVADCLAAARHLAAEGSVDAEAIFIRGGSAGGHVALLAVCAENVFRGAVSYFGVSDPRALAEDTHKFESRYYDTLIGPLPQSEHLYAERAPVRRVAEIAVPVLLLQGLDDKVVPPAQTEAMVAALRARGVPVATASFAGEGHGFRRADTISRSLEMELWFYARVLGGDAGPAPPGLSVAGL
jgi:dipeptidyl aminopeptidase/acylaminoacyl peptidase